LHCSMAGARITRNDFEAAPWCTGGASCAPSPSPTIPSCISGFTFGLFHRFKLVYLREFNLGVSCFFALLSSVVWHCGALELDVYANVETFSFH
jgi:hypothetical protein